MGDDHLTVGLGSKSTRFKKWLFVPDTSRVDIETSLNIVDGIDNEMNSLPEGIVEDLFGIRTNSCHVVSNVHVRVHLLSDFASSLRFRVSDITLSEQELSVQVGDFDVVVVSAVDNTASAATNAHESKRLHVFATESASTDHENFGVGKFRLDFLTVDKCLIVVSVIHWCAISFLGDCLKDVVMEPLLEGRVFASVLNHFLS